jgi:hypothetical protein
VLVQGVQQDPQKFLAGGGTVPATPAPAAAQRVAAVVLPPDHRPH